VVLGHSRESFCALTGSQDLVTFWSCHRQAFAHFGGVPRELLYDRTKTVLRSHVGKDATLEERRFHPERSPRRTTTGSRCGCVAPTAPRPRARSSTTCPTSASDCCARTASAAMQANSAWRSWNDDVARSRVHGTHGEVVAERAQRDRAALLPLPATA
jgi:hypothetical protein